MKPRGINLTLDDVQPPAKAGVMVLLDRSGSMGAIAPEMEAAFAEFVVGQKAAPGELWLTLHQFDGGGYDVTYDKRPISEVGALGLKPRGSTPLWKSLHRFLTDAHAVLADQSDETERLLLVIVTDGQNTDHHGATPVQCKELLSGLEAAGIEAIWLGTSAAVLEAQEEIPSFGGLGAVTQTNADDVGAYAAASYYVGSLTAASNSMRSGGSARAASAHFTNTVTPEQAAANRTGGTSTSKP